MQLLPPERPRVSLQVPQLPPSLPGAPVALPSPGVAQPSRGETSSTGDPLRVTPQRGGPSSHPCGRSRCSGAGGANAVPGRGVRLTLFT